MCRYSLGPAVSDRGQAGREVRPGPANIDQRMSQDHSITVPAEAEALRDVRHFLAPLLKEAIPHEADRLVLAVDECCSNVVRHRSDAISDGQIHLKLEVDDRAIRIFIESFCFASQVDNIRPRDVEDHRPGGLGTHFVSQIADRIDYIPSPRHPGSVTLVIEKSLAPAPRSSTP